MKSRSTFAAEDRRWWHIQCVAALALLAVCAAFLVGLATLLLGVRVGTWIAIAGAQIDYGAAQFGVILLAIVLLAGTPWGAYRAFRATYSVVGAAVMKFGIGAQAQPNQMRGADAHESSKGKRCQW